MINIANDQIFEGREYFRLRLSAIRTIGQAADFYVPQTGFENTFVDINIEDDDCKSSSSPSVLPRNIIVYLLFDICY